jgi:hypothetical protein
MLGVVSFTSDNVLVNLAGLSADRGDTLILDVTSSAVVPEPSAMALLTSALAGVFGVRRRRSGGRRRTG